MSVMSCRTSRSMPSLLWGFRRWAPERLSRFTVDGDAITACRSPLPLPQRTDPCSGYTARVMRKALIVALGLAACAALALRAAGPDELDVVKVRKNFYMIAGGGGNIGVQIGSDGVVLVNSGSAAASDQVLATLKKLTDLPTRYIINVDAGPEFVGGNEKLSRAGYTIFTNALGGGAAALPNGGGASILSHDSVLRVMSTGKSAYPSGAWPNEAFFTPRKAIRMNDEGIEIFYQPSAHSNADSFVLFRSSDVVVTGDVMDTTRFPMIDLPNGGS